MSVEKADQATGSFSVSLRDVPFDVYDATDPNNYGFGLLVITRAPFAPGITNRTTILGSSIFTGVYRKRALSDRGITLTGAHAAWYMGDEDGKGDLPEITVPVGTGGSYTKTLAQFAGARAYGTGGADGFRPTALTAGALDTSATQRYYRSWLQTPKADMTAVCDLFGDTMTWRVTDGLALDAGSIDMIYGTNYPILLPDWYGSDPLAKAINATFTLEQDLEDYITRSRVQTSDNTYNWATTAANLVFEDGQGGSLAVTMNSTFSNPVTPGTSSAQLQYTTASLVGKYSQIKNRLTVSTDEHGVMQTVQCGGYIYAWDPLNGIYSDGNTTATYYKGRQIYPLKLRVFKVTMPIEEGLGVYFIDLNDRVTNLTPYVEWESPGARLEVGDFSRRLAPSMQLSGVYGKR